MSNEAEYNKGGMIAFILAMVITAVFFFYILFMHPRPKYNEIEGVKKQAQADLKKEAEKAAPQEEPEKKPEPEAPKSDLWVSSSEMVKKGETAYKIVCGICHGDSGKGDGPAGVALKPPPRNLIEGKWTQGKGSPFDLFKSVTEGLPGTGMAPFGHLPLEDRWAIVHYLSSITNNKVPVSQAEIDAYKAGSK